MRLAALVLAILLAAPALAQGWGHYANARFGYGIDVPPGFVGHGESDNGDGQGFSRIEAEQTLLVWGGMLPGSFEAAFAERLASEQGDGWSVTEQVQVPQWAWFAAQRDHRLVYQRLIPLCDGASYAAFRIEHSIRDLNQVVPVLEGLARSFVAEGC